MCQPVIFFVVLSVYHIDLSVILSAKYLDLGVQIPIISNCSLLVMFDLGELA